MSRSPLNRRLSTASVCGGPRCVHLTKNASFHSDFASIFQATARFAYHYPGNVGPNRHSRELPGPLSIPPHPGGSMQNT